MAEDSTESARVERSILRNANEPLAKRGWLKNGNPVGDYSKATRCGAKTRRGTHCQAPAMKNGRCRLHGGLSTGPKTPEGLARSRKARWKHGLYSAEAKQARRAFRVRSKWENRFFGMLERVDEMFLLLDEIAERLDNGQLNGLMRKCAKALRMNEQIDRFIADGCRLHGREAPRVSSVARQVRAILEAGASGGGPDETR